MKSLAPVYLALTYNRCTLYGVNIYGIYLVTSDNSEVLEVHNVLLVISIWLLINSYLSS